MDKNLPLTDGEKALLVTKIGGPAAARKILYGDGKTPFLPPDLCSTIQLLKPTCAQDTSSDPHGWSPENPFYGHGAVIALWVHEKYGGIIIRHDLLLLQGFEHMGAHYSNTLPDGTTFDVTACQFEPMTLPEALPLHLCEASPERDDLEIEANRYGSDLLASLPRRECSREDLLLDPDTRRRYELLQKRVQAHILSGLGKISTIHSDLPHSSV